MFGERATNPKLEGLWAMVLSQYCGLETAASFSFSDSSQPPPDGRRGGGHAGWDPTEFSPVCSMSLQHRKAYAHPDRKSVV